MKTPTTIDPNKLRTRDYLMVRLICGATKSAVHVDHRKVENRRACRGRVFQEE